MVAKGNPVMIGREVITGFYKEKKLADGNTLVYPYLCGWYYDGIHPEKEAMKEYFSYMEERLKEEKRKNTIVFCVPNVNQLKNIYEGKNQILNRSFVL